jgi:hypothetical protein
MPAQARRVNGVKCAHSSLQIKQNQLKLCLIEFFLNSPPYLDRYFGFAAVFQRIILGYSRRMFALVYFNAAFRAKGVQP